MATIYINGRFLTQTMTGVQRYARETLSAMDLLLSSGRRTTPFDLQLLAPTGTERPTLKAIGFRAVGPLHGHAWEQVTLPIATRGGWLLSFGPTGPLAKKQQIVTMHDAATRAVPDAYSALFRSWNNLLLPALARRTPYLMTVSQFSKSEVMRHFGARHETTRISGEGWQHMAGIQPEPAILARHGLHQHGYLLAVSSITRHKNFAVIVRAIKLLRSENVRIVIVGSLEHSVFGALDPSVLAGVTQTGRVSDGELCALYGGAAAFIYPSVYEGFGIPPLEAMSQSCPVLASNAAAIRETCGDAALYFDPHNAEQLADAIVDVLRTPSRRADLVARGTARLGVHDWENAANEHLSLLQHAFEQGVARRSALAERQPTQ